MTKTKDQMKSEASEAYATTVTLARETCEAIETTARKAYLAELERINALSDNISN